VTLDTVEASPIAAATRSRESAWNRIAADWPHREASRFVNAGGVHWHVQRMGRGPTILLVHGTGASSHSWAGVMQLLSRRFTVIAPDLPGHGFTERPASARMALPAVAESLHALLHELEDAPHLAVGHSAGAAILARMALDGRIRPAGLVSLNGALLPMHGWAGLVFSPAARLLSLNPFVPRLFAWRASDPAAVRRLVASTGSTLGDAAAERYAQLLRYPAHVAGALAMMANWDLVPLQRDLPALSVPLALVTAERDQTLPPAEADRVHRLVPAAERVSWPDLGHLAHEERPDLAADLILQCAYGWSAPRPARRSR
jgi:magnesium chelatase accessory protein